MMSFKRITFKKIKEEKKEKEKGPEGPFKYHRSSGCDDVVFPDDLVLADIDDLHCIFGT
jgi:hypothetical protein